MIKNSSLLNNSFLTSGQIVATFCKQVTACSTKDIVLC
ncbi:hypothetical protein HPS12939_1144 [Glaesserella parasuis 12939]|nr:hypothetical protein HPSSW114_0793 [Glaesserella parasuis SW114]EQA05422.1 hypothetical protein HPS12939_1144 [Glaesserella parasuis 12939]EQA09454.1 hypothetical protein HPSD74_1425 [Glaesserella parasuis D74]EQA12888.1 hypothetical protein HPS174_0946 [Glaesserella parasuis 174]EQA13491.1 hypothetical protein HPSSW140_0413 [Glaesserella parasuis SW140]